MVKAPLKLSPDDQHYLEALLRKGQLPARMFRRVTGLLERHRGRPCSEIAVTLGVSRTTVYHWLENYRHRGIKCIHEAPRSGRPIEIDGRQRAKLTALACSEPPPGHSRWHLRLLADKVVELGYCQSISHTYVGKLLKKKCPETPLKPKLVSGRT